MSVAVFTMGWSMPSMSTQLPAGTRFTSILYLQHKAGSVKTKWLHSVSVVTRQALSRQSGYTVSVSSQGRLCQDKVATQCQCRHKAGSVKTKWLHSVSVVTRQALSRQSGYTVSVSCHHKVCSVKTKWQHSVSVVSSQGTLSRHSDYTVSLSCHHNKTVSSV